MKTFIKKIVTRWHRWKLKPVIVPKPKPKSHMRWEGFHHADGRLEFVIGDSLSGDLQTFWLEGSDLHADEVVHVSASGNAETGEQFLGIVWTNQDGQPQSARLMQSVMIPSTWTPRHTSLRYQSHIVITSRGNDKQGFVARMLISPKTPKSGRHELFHIQEESTEQVKPLLGDTTGDGVVDTRDILAMLTQFSIGAVDITDLLAVIQNFGVSEVAPDNRHSRLIYWQLVGGSFRGGVDHPNHIHPQIYNDEDGWQADVDHRIGPVVDYLGKGTFDMWFHNIGGYWYDHDQKYPSEHTTQPMIFDQLEHAREQRPGLVDDLSTVTDYLVQNDIEYYAYIGMPRSWQPAHVGGFTPQADHGKSNLVHRFYGELLQHGFKGVGHDASVNIPATSTWMTELAPEVERRGLEVILEAIPQRGKKHLLGYSVVAEHRVWEAFAERRPDMFYTEAEIIEAGGRAIHILTWPLGMGPGEPDWDPDFDYHAYHFETGKRLLEEGKTVAMGLSGLLERGYRIEELVAAAK